MAGSGVNALALLVAQTGLVVLVARLLALVAGVVRQPMVVAEVAAGIVLGPSLLGWLWPEAQTALFPEASLEVLGAVSHFGLLFFMFLIGLELEPRILRGRARVSVVVSTASIAVPFALGGLLALAIHPWHGGNTPLGSFILFMGVAMSITAFPVLARILSERRLLGSSVGAVSIACAAVNDIAAWCLLAAVAGYAQAQGMAEAGWTALWTVLYIAAMVLLVRPLLARIGARVGGRAALTQGMVAVVFLLLFASSWATERIGIHALFGAFLIGAVMPRAGGLAKALTERIEDLVVIVLLPLFFAYSGLKTQIGLLDSWSEWLLCLGIILVACVGKFGGSAAAARWVGFSAREASAIGVLMNTRGLMELIVLNIGLELGVISPEIFTMMVLMALVTTVMTSPILSWLLPAQPSHSTAALAGVDAAVLVCVADPGLGQRLAVLGHALLRGRSNPVLHVLHLTRTRDRLSQYLDDPAGQARAAEDVLGPIGGAAENLGLGMQTLVMETDDPASDICRVARARAARLILMGGHKPLLEASYLGGVSGQVMETADCDVAVLIDRGLSRVEKVLLPYRGGAGDRVALRLANRLMRGGATVVLLHVVPPDRADGGPKLGATEALAGAFPAEAAGSGAVEVLVVKNADPLAAVLAEAGKGYDLLLVGCGEAWGLDRRLRLRPEELIHDSPVSLLVVSGSQEPGARQTTMTVMPSPPGGVPSPG